MAKPKSKPQTDDEFAKTWALYDELASRRESDLDSTTAVLQALTVHEVEQILDDDDETRTDVYPVPGSGNRPK